MAKGLQLVSEGERLVAHHPLLAAARMRARGGAPFAIGLARVAQASGPRAKLTMLVRLIDEAERDPRRNARLAPRRGIRRAIARAQWIGGLVPDALRTIRSVRRARRS
jgi:hypothetical protein